MNILGRGQAGGIPPSGPIPGNLQKPAFYRQTTGNLKPGFQYGIGLFRLR
jgi:hypothetical protein